MTNKNAFWAFMLFFAVSVGIFIGGFFNFNKTSAIGFSNNAQEAKIKRLINYIQYDYVDKIDTDSLLDKTINNLLANLDPHSVYIPKDELAATQETMEGKFMGIGIQFRMIRDTVTVINVIKNGPSEKIGIKSGDRILKSNDSILFGKNYNSDDVMHFFKSKKSTPIHLLVYRKSENKIVNFNFKRNIVNIESVPVYYMINKTLGYIKIDLFARNTAKEFKVALDSLQQNGMQQLIVDLRNNSGGFMDVANDIVDEFLPNKSLIVFTKSKSGNLNYSYATSKGSFETGKLYVLINEESASASEIVAGAIQDNDRGTIVGRRSFGKGLVQQEMELGDGSAVRLTTARYYTPTGRSIQKPYDHNGNEDYYNESIVRAHNGELFTADSIKKIDSLKYTTPKGKIVYGGGGITPDVFVAVDSTFYLPSFHLMNFNDSVFDYVDSNRKKLNTYNFQTFEKEFDINDLLNKTFKSNINEIKKNSEMYDRMKWYLKAMVARELFGEEGFYKIYQQNDAMILKVLELEKNSLK